MLGKIMETYFEKDCNTSWIIDALEQKHGGEYRYDTLQLLRVFRLRFVNPKDSNTKCFSVSLYVKRAEDGVASVLDTKLTLSKMKKIYAEKYFDQAEAEKDLFLSALIDQIKSIDWEQEKQDILFDTALTFKAQALVNWTERGKTKIYHIVGVCLEKSSQI